MSKLKELEKRLKDEPDSLGLRVMLASALLEAGRRGDAIEAYRWVAIAYRDQGGIQQAIAVCRSILAIAPDDDRSRQLLQQLVDAARAHEAQPPRLPRPPRPGPSDSHDVQRDPDGDDAGDSARFSPFDVTPLPAPLPYHIAYPTASMPAVTHGDVQASAQDDLLRHPQLSGIVSAAREISASLIAASHDDEESEDDLAGELETRRLPRITPDDLRLISGPPPSFVTDQIPVPEISEDLAGGGNAEPMLLPGSDSPLDAGTVDDETTRPRDMPLRKRPPSIAPPTSATGPLAGAFFMPVPPRDRAAVLQRFRRRMTAGGTTVIRRGDTGHGLVVVVRGRLEVQADRANGGRVVLAAISPGDYVGETSLLTRSPAMADIVATIDSEIMVLAESEFYEVTGAFPALWIELKAVAERRTREHEQRLRGQPG